MKKEKKYKEEGSAKLLKMASQTSDPVLKAQLEKAAYELSGLEQNGLPLPETHTLYIASSESRQKDLADMGYPSVFANNPERLAEFTGSDIVLTDPCQHHWELPERFQVTRTNCWPKGWLNVIDTVPMMTHLLTLAETIDLIPIQSSKLGKQAQAIYKAFGNDDEPEYRRLVKGLVAA